LRILSPKTIASYPSKSALAAIPGAYGRKKLTVTTQIAEANTDFLKHANWQDDGIG
jgi:hypothetical protein